MIGHINMRLLQAATLGAAILVSRAAFAQDDRIARLTENLRAVETLASLGDDLRTVVSTDLGFSRDQVQRWSSAMEAAFDRDMLEAEFVAALDARLSETTRQAALDYQASPLGQEAIELAVNAPDIEDAPDYLIEAEADLEQASNKRSALHEAQFEAENGAAHDSAIMDMYFRAMQIAASPVLGVEVAEQWVASAQYLREEVAQNHFLTYVSIYGQLPEDRHETLVAVLSSPEMIDFSLQSTQALAETMRTASDRLETEYTNGVNK